MLWKSSNTAEPGLFSAQHNRNLKKNDSDFFILLSDLLWHNLNLIQHSHRTCSLYIFRRQSCSVCYKKGTKFQKKTVQKHGHNFRVLAPWQFSGCLKTPGVCEKPVVNSQRIFLKLFFITLYVLNYLSVLFWKKRFLKSILIFLQTV